MKKHVLHVSQLNKGTAFNEYERKKFGILGKLPPRIETLEEQADRVYSQLKLFETPKQKNIFLNELYNTNITLFYKIAVNHIAEIVLLLYTPHVATFCQDFSKEFRNANNALYISYKDRDCLDEILENVDNKKHIDVIVVTDGERILGIGDQGVGGVGIPIGKLMLYTLFGGINPSRTLPIVLDVGTNNEKHLNDPFYLGLRSKRINGEKYYDFIDNFVQTLKKKMPNVFLQWEDFGRNNASKILLKYRDEMCSFNDDIQGTAAVTLSAVLNAVKILKQSIKSQRIVFFGSGSASIGIANLLCNSMMREGMSHFEARKNFWLINSKGLITSDCEHIDENQKPYIRSKDEIYNWVLKDQNCVSLEEVVYNVHPTILIGCSTVGGSFTENIVKTMASFVENPIILPLSNPTSNCEALPEDIIKWTCGKAMVATGSPFPVVIFNGKKHIISQCNNAFVFPGIGLGIAVTKASKVSDEMIWVASQTLVEETLKLQHYEQEEFLLPDVTKARAVAKLIGCAVAKQVIKEDLNKVNISARSVEKAIESYYWNPQYH